MKIATEPPKTPGLSVSEAQACILGKIIPLDAEEVGLGEALGRALAEEVCANRDLPPYDVSAMDGYATRAADIGEAPKTLQIIEDIKAGDTPRFSLQPGQCARIMTGAPLPPGADTIVRLEDTRPLEHDKVEFPIPVKPGTDIRQRGESMREGEVVLQPGEEITPGTIGVLATVKRAKVKVVRKPRVAILSNGDELEALDEPFDPRKIPDSNSYALMAQTQALGIEPILLGIARDNPEELASFLRQGLEYDVLLISGGTSVGVHDHVRPTLAALGVTIHFWRVEMRPGHPVAFGTSDHALVFCLPGNPVSSMVCFEQLVLPALRRLMGHRRLFRRAIPVRLAKAVKTKQGRAEFVRATLSRDASGAYVATPAASQSSGNILSMTHADVLLVAPGRHNALNMDETAQAQLLESAIWQSTPDTELDGGFLL
ncbi:MAG: molybdopterin molybdotransferase MoeA [Betaproteobacteria bacterium]|nr:molybdopterin molybdotransferase MoeA [Betaproteobacteria bacterium]